MNTETRLRIVWLMVATAFLYLGIIVVAESRSSTAGVVGDHATSPSVVDEELDPEDAERREREELEEAVALAKRFPDSWVERVEDRGGTMLRVMSPDGKRGVAGARVVTKRLFRNAMLALLAFMTPEDQNADYSLEFEDLDDGTATTYVTDSRGYCSLPTLMDQLVIRVESDEGYLPPTPGFGAWARSLLSPVMHLTLRPLVEPEFCRVLDTKRRPVQGVDVVLKGAAKNNRLVFERIASARTGADGIAKFAAFDLEPGHPRQCEFALIDPIHCLPAPEPKSGSAFQHDLRLPPCGEMRLEFLAPDGRPFRGDLTLRVSAMSASSPARWIRRKSRDSVFDLKHIPFNHRLAVSGFAEDGRFEIAKIEFSGPTSSRPIVEKIIRLQEARPTVSMRLQDASGSSITDHEAILRLIRTNTDDEQLQIEVDRSRTDADGRCRFVLDREIFEQAQTQKLEVLLESRRGPGSPSNSAPRRGALLDAKAARRSDRGLEFGDVVLSELPVVTRGRVVDERGRPVAGVRVLPVPETEIEGEPPGFARHVMPSWASSDLQGVFEINSASRLRPRKLILKKPGYPWMQADVPPQRALGGAVEFEDIPTVTLPRAGHAELTFKALPVAREDLRVVMKGVPVAINPLWPDVSEKREGIWTGDDTVVWSGLRAGRGIVEVFGSAAPLTPLITIYDVEIRAGAVASDPRLIDVDVTSGNWQQRILVADAKGAGLPDVQIEMADDDGFRRIGRTDARGELTLLAAAPLGQLRFVKAGYQALAVERLGNQVEFTMRPAPRVRLELVKGFPVPKPPQFLVVRPQETRDDAWNDLTKSWIFDEDGTCLIQVWRPGRYRLNFSLRYQVEGEADAQTHLPRPIEALEFEIHDIQDLQTKQLFPNRKRFNDCLQQAQDRP